MRKIKQTTTSIDKFQLPIEIKKEGDYFLANCPVWTDCYAQALSIEEVVAEITSVAKTLIDLYREEGLTIPLKRLEGKTLTKNDKFSLDVPVFAHT